MKLKDGFFMRQIAGQTVVLPGGDVLDLNMMITLNETGAFLWKLMSQKDCSEEELVDALLAEYEVEREIAARDVHALVEQMREKKLFV